eukprot:CAMPEP_0118970924 /NCGR_PEP_ID=MMETSP1173-20130426/7694_1 /TAXON_ID=1034831 /ORGANISM="Rhizochromulina marina cf, Strain CCMP1243" /LENGTH=715 /DNA_ID=CAMNT_0006920339 /DNA_START=130 /DNA_END=2277 /DNA_ORIENTATION=+
MERYEQELASAAENAEEWEALDFDTLRLALDDQAEGFAQEIDERTQARRALGSLAKAFRQDAERAAKKEAPPLSVSRVEELIRSFKAEVDATLSRAKSAEAAFLSLYRLLSRPKLTDPALALRRLARAAQDALEEKEQSPPYTPESTPRPQTPVSRVPNAAVSPGPGSTPREALSSTQGVEAKAEIVLARLAEVGLTPGSAHAVDSGSAVAALERIFDDERRAARHEAERSLSQSYETERAALLAQCDDRVARATALAEKRAHSLEAQLSLLVSRNEEGSAAAVEVAEASAVAAQAALAEANHRNKDLERLVAEGKARIRALESKISELRDTTSSTAAESERLQEVVKGQETQLHSALRRLTALQEQRTLVRGAQAPHDGDRHTLRDRYDGEKAEEDAEDVLAWHRRQTNKWKDIADEAQARQASEEAARSCAEAEKHRLAQDLSEKDELVARLENDLIAAHQVVEAGKIMLRSFQEKMPSAASSTDGSSGVLVAFPSLPSADSAVTGAANDKLAQAKHSGSLQELPQYIGGFGSADRILEAVQGQKERLRKRLLEREGELALAKRISDQLSAEASQLRSDNMQLYRKIRVLSVAGSAKGGRNGTTAVEAKYEQLHDAVVNPFLHWDDKEEGLAFDELSWPERTLLAGLKHGLRSRIRRVLIVATLVFLWLYLALRCSDARASYGSATTNGDPHDSRRESGAAPWLLRGSSMMAQ